MNHRMGLCWHGVVLLQAMLFCQAAAALNPKVQISQYGHTAWRMQDGIFASKPNSIAQTADGYIWLGTAAGLLRFDGVRFSPWVPPRGQTLGDAHVWALLAAQDGSLWVGTRTGLLHLVNGTLLDIPIGGATVESLFEGEHGIVWLTRGHVAPSDAGGPLCAVTGLSVRCYGAKDGLPYGSAEQAIQDGAGNIWIAGDPLTEWRAGSTVFYDQIRNQSMSVLQGGPQALTAGLDGSIWVGMLQPGPGLGLQHLMDDSFSPVVLPGFDSSTLKVASLFTDSQGDVWVGTMDQGMYRLHGSSVSHFNAADGLSSNAVYNFLEDREGDLWTITSEGVDRFRNLAVATYSMHEGLSADKAGTVVAARDGSIWVGNYYAVDVLRADGMSSLGVNAGFPGTMVTTMMEDHEGRMWVAVDDKLSIVENGKFRRVELAAGSSIGTIFTMIQDTNGDVWLSNDKSHNGKLFRVRGSDVVEQKLPADTQGVYSTAPDPKGGLWLGLRSGDLAHLEGGVVRSFPEAHSPGFSPLRAVSTTSSGFVLALEANGLLAFRNDVSRELTAKNGLPCDAINSFVTDLRGDLYLNTACGILIISADDWQRWWSAPTSIVRFRQIGALDGARTERSGLSPAAARSPDGRIWFVNERVLQVIDPNDLAKNTVPPPVAIERVMADGKQYQLGAPVTFPPHLRALQVDYTALSFVAPERVLFRYRLEGHDTGWQDAGTRRQALYNDLAPGKYRFRVIACNNDGVWNLAGASFPFDVTPAFSQTAAFKVAVGFLFIVVLWIVYLFRIRQITAAVQARLEERITERERIARELHDTFLQGFQGLMLLVHSVMSRMRSDDPDRQVLAVALDKADQVLVDGRGRVSNLRSENEIAEDFIAALDSVGRERAASTTIEFRQTILGPPRILNPALRADVLAIAREALVNAFNHSQAAVVQVELSYGRSRFKIVIADDGQGMPPEMLHHGRSGHWGLAGMRERAKKIGAELAIASKVGSGTQVTLTLRSTLAYIESLKRA